jgi:hypothetical protein
MNCITMSLLLAIIAAFCKPISAYTNYQPVTQEDIIVTEIDEIIQKEAQQINEMEQLYSANDDRVLELYNEQGISYFVKGDYYSALMNFNHILEIKSSSQEMGHLIVGSALWGRALCHACLDLTEETIHDLKLLEEFFLNPFRCYEREKELTSDYKEKIVAKTKAKFANPNEKISA